MLQSKDIKNLSELSLTFCSKHKKAEFFTSFVGILKLGKLHAYFSSAKQKGVSGLLIIEILLSFPFLTQNNVHRFINSNWNTFVNHGKDVYYRLKKNNKIDWRNFLLAVVRQSLLTLKNNESDQGIKAFIFDDTTIKKTGQKIEGTSRVWNHVISRTVLGYQLLVMGYYNGTIFIPINFSFHREKGRNKKTPYGLKPKHYKKQHKNKNPKESSGFKRKKELDCSKIESAINMLKSAIKKGIKSEYVLADSWFTCWQMVKTALDNKLKYIGMFSKSKTKFTYRGELMTYGKIRRLNQKNLKRNKRYNLYYIRTVVNWNGYPIVLYFSRKGKRGNWKTLLSTDLTSNFNQTAKIYLIRWSIEVFFKESKQYLGLGKSQSVDFNAQIADTTIVMIQHIFLSIKNAIEKYETLGKLFEGTKAECLETKLHDRLLQLLIDIVEKIDQILGEVDSEDMISKIIHNDEIFEKLKLIIYPQKNTFKNTA